MNKLQYYLDHYVTSIVLNNFIIFKLIKKKQKTKIDENLMRNGNEDIRILYMHENPWMCVC